MINDTLLQLLFLIGDLLLVYLTCRKVKKYRNIPIRKLMLGICAVIPAGFAGCKIMRVIEAGTLSGISFYGAVLIAPFLMVLLGLVLKVDPKVVLDLGAPVACSVLPFMKLQCLITGCCFGRIIKRLPNGRVIRFPSQAVEMICGIILFCIILQIEKSEKQKGYVYAWFLVLYGSSRFFLDLLRQTKPFIYGMSAGCFWSLISVSVGGCFLIAKRRKEATQCRH